MVTATKTFSDQSLKTSQANARQLVEEARPKTISEGYDNKFQTLLLIMCNKTTDVELPTIYAALCNKKSGMTRLMVSQMAVNKADWRMGCSQALIGKNYLVLNTYMAGLGAYQDCALEYQDALEEEAGALLGPALLMYMFHIKLPPSPGCQNLSA